MQSPTEARRCAHLSKSFESSENPTLRLPVSGSLIPFKKAGKSDEYRPLSCTILSGCLERLSEKRP